MHALLIRIHLSFPAFPAAELLVLVETRDIAGRENLGLSRDGRCRGCVLGLAWGREALKSLSRGGRGAIILAGRCGSSVGLRRRGQSALLPKEVLEKRGEDRGVVPRISFF